MRADQARQIPIAIVLNRAGIKPAKVTRQGRELWYSSPLREGDKTPSFKVDTVKNLWFDHGLARGGNVIDLVIDMRRVTVKEALAILDSGFGQMPKVAATPRERTAPAGENENDGSDRAFRVVSVRDIASPALVEYLHSRCISKALASRYLREIRFSPPLSSKQFYALGFASGNGHDARSPVFKGFVGTGKDITTFNFADKGTVAVFEGAFDFLSWLAWCGREEPDCGVIVMNSVSLSKRALDAITAHGFGRIQLYLDHDRAGRETSSTFIAALSNRNVVDRSSLYAGHKDFNAWWIAEKILGRP